MESCGLKCLKWLMFAFNVLFFICGCAILALGIWVVVDGQSFSRALTIIDADNAVFSNAAYVSIAVGVALIVISFFGFCGAVKENKCMLGTFFGIVLVIFIVEIVATILAFVYYPQVVTVLRNSMNDFDPAEPVNSTSGNVETLSWNLIQSAFECCGFDSPNNWENTTKFPYNPPSGGFPELVPKSCCTVENNQPIDGNACLRRLGNYYEEGCEPKIRGYFWVIGGVGIAILVVELLALIFSCCLFRAAGKDDNYA